MPTKNKTLAVMIPVKVLGWAVISLIRVIFTKRKNMGEKHFMTFFMRFIFYKNKNISNCTYFLASGYILYSAIINTKTHATFKVHWQEIVTMFTLEFNSSKLLSISLGL